MAEQNICRDCGQYHDACVCDAPTAPASRFEEVYQSYLRAGCEPDEAAARARTEISAE